MVTENRWSVCSEKWWSITVKYPLLTKGYVQYILGDEKELSAKFNNEPDPDSIETLVVYIRLLDEKYPLSTTFK